MTRLIHLEGGQALVEGDLVETTVTLEQGAIVDVGAARPEGALAFDAKGLFVLPGMVDIHGDGFERQIMPRPGVSFAYPLALADTDRQLAAAGISTAYHGLTLSWEPGLRSVEAGRVFMTALEEARPSLAIDHHVQLRLETFAFEAADDIIAWLDADPKPTLAFNDHTSMTARKLAEGRRSDLAQWAKRSGLSEDSYVGLFEQFWARGPEVEAFVDHLAAKARAAGVVMLSHDDRTIEERSRYRHLGATIAEFPMTDAAIREADSFGEPTVLGAPNVVRGGSHTGALGAADMIEAGLCSILASDYHYPSMLAAIHRLMSERGLALKDVWPLVSSTPARALELHDRGRIETGTRGDLVLIDMVDGGQLKAIATFAAGKLAYLTGDTRIL